MIRRCLWIAAAGAILFGLVASLYAHPKIICLALLIVLLLAMLVAQIRLLLVGFLRWRRSTKFWLMPAVVCAAVISLSLCFGSMAGRHISDLVFRKHSDEYLKIVAAFHDGSLNCVTSCSGNVGMIETAALPADVRQVYGTHCDGGGVLVLFSLRMTCLWFTKATSSETMLRPVTVASGSARTGSFGRMCPLYESSIGTGIVSQTSPVSRSLFPAGGPLKRILLLRPPD